MNKLQHATQKLVTALIAVESNASIISFAELCPTIKFGEDSIHELVRKLKGSSIRDELKRFLIHNRPDPDVESSIVSCQTLISKYKTNSAIVGTALPRIEELTEHMNAIRKYGTVLGIIDKLKFANDLYNHLTFLIDIDTYLESSNENASNGEILNYMLSRVFDISETFKCEPNYVLISLIENDPDYKNLTALNRALDGLIERIRAIIDLMEK